MAIASYRTVPDDLPGFGNIEWTSVTAFPMTIAFDVQNSRSPDHWDRQFPVVADADESVLR